MFKMETENTRGPLIDLCGTPEKGRVERGAAE